MSWLSAPFNSGEKRIATEEETVKETEKPLKRWIVLLLMLPGQIFFWCLIIYNLSIGNKEALLGIVGYVIVANIFSSGKKTYDLWTIQYWDTDIFFKIILFPGKIIWTSFLFLFSLIRYNL